MTISVTNVGSISNGAGAKTLFNVNIPAGSLIVVCVSHYVNVSPTSGNPYAATILDSAGNHYTLAAEAFNGANPGFGYGAIYYTWNSNAISNGWVEFFWPSSTTAAMSVMYATGIDTLADPLDRGTIFGKAAGSVGAGGPAGSISPSVTSGAPIVAGELFIASASWTGSNTATFSMGSGGWTSPPVFEHATAACPLAGGHLIGAGTGTVTFAPTLGAGGENINYGASLVCGFRPAGTTPKAGIVPINLDLGVNKAAGNILAGVTVPAGALIVLVGAENGSSTGGYPTAADSAGNTYKTLLTPNFGGIAGNGYNSLLYAYNASPIDNGWISYAPSPAAPYYWFTAFYATGVMYNADPLDVGYYAAGGTGTHPSVTMGGAPQVANDLIVGTVGWGAATSDTFTQDTAHGFSTPPFAFVVTNAGVAGGTKINAGTAIATYAPTISVSRQWAAIIAAFKPLPPIIRRARAMVLG